MKRQILLYLSFALVLFFALLNVRIPSPTGAEITDYDETQSVHAMRLHDEVKTFFGIQGIMFPEGTCGNVAMQLYEDTALKSLDVTAGFSNSGTERIASTNFVIDRLRRYGTLDMVKGANLLENYNVDSMMSINMESIVTVPKEDRTNFFSMDLMGFSGGMFIVNKGRFSTPSFECVFARYNGEIVCDCDAHPISGIEIAGITGIKPPVDYDARIRAKLEQIHGRQ